MKDYPPFDRAVERFRNFLGSGGFPQEIAWVAPEDAALIGPYLFIKFPDPDPARNRARSDYQAGCERDLGVLLGVLCKAGAKLCCYVYSPQDEGESARRMMPDGLKLTYPTPMRHAYPIRNRWQWQQRRFDRWSKRCDSRKMHLFDRE
jgi:hypothetical protein